MSTGCDARTASIDGFSPLASLSVTQKVESPIGTAWSSTSKIESARRWNSGKPTDSLADAQRLSHTGSFITDLLADDHNWSEEAFRIFKFDPATKVTVQRIRDISPPRRPAVFESGSREP